MRSSIKTIFYTLAVTFILGIILFPVRFGIYGRALSMLGFILFMIAGMYVGVRLAVAKRKSSRCNQR